MGNRRLKNKSWTEYKRHKQREKRRLVKKRSKSRTIPREVPIGYFEIDKVVVGYMREYLKSINPRQIFSTIDDTIPTLKRRVAICMYRQDKLGFHTKLVVPFINYAGDMVLMELTVARQTILFRYQFSNPSFFQKFLLFLDRMNLYYWCQSVTRGHIEKLNEPILQKLLKVARISCNLDEIESGKIKIGCSSVAIRDGNVLTNGLIIATLDQAVLDPYTVASRIREALAHVQWQ